MKRAPAKPPQEIYRPGSGPLRKSTLGEENEYESFDRSKNKAYSSHNDLRYREDSEQGPRKPRKPEQPIYVPKPLANRWPEMAEQSERQQNNGNYDNYRKAPFNPRRRGGSNANLDEGDDWHRPSSRNHRPGSESRGPPMRDTRSVEPSEGHINRNYEKPHPKPPSGRRHSTIGVEPEKRNLHKPSNIDKLPPRLRKKFLEQNKTQNEDWNGSSMTFNTNNYHQYNTLPAKGRGRGRFNLDYERARSRTPDVGYTSPCNSRPPTPPCNRTRSNDNLQRGDSRPQSPVGYQKSNGRDRGPRRPARYSRRREERRNDNQQVQEEGNWNEEEKVKSDSPTTVSPPSFEERICPLLTFDNNVILDWSEEVELEAEALSEALTRSSSVVSLAAPPSTSGRRSKARRNRRRSGSSAREPEQFRVPHEIPLRSRRQRRPSRDTSFERRSHNPSRESSFERPHRTEPENWRAEIVRSRQNSETSDRSRCNSERDSGAFVQKAGVLVLPPKQPESTFDHPKLPETVRKPAPQKSLFDPNNPNKPIIVRSPSSRVSVPGFSDDTEQAPPQMYAADQFGNVRPGWYAETSESFKSCHFPKLIEDIKKADLELQNILYSGLVLINWGIVESLRQFLKDSLQYLLCKDLKFCQRENVEQHLWKILYHNIIEVTRKAITNDPSNKEQYKTFLLYLIDEGNTYFEGLLESLEDIYNFKLNEFLRKNNMGHTKGLGYIGLALVSTQKLLLFLGDLGRYREQVNETCNYAKCRQWYIKAHEINPKNAKPYNQLAVLAVYDRRKLDAVYYYMRSLMSSNPVPSTREYLNSLFDENRKKYEQGERKRREERLERARQHMKQKESEDRQHMAGCLRHETWIRPDGGRRVHRTTQALQEQKDSEEEDLAALSSVDVNKRFVVSYLHVHGKLITRIGMESFQEAAMQMLKEFRALLQHSPVPIHRNRFLQLLALNMFAIENTQLKDPQQLQAGYRSELQERALVVSLQMFNLILERCVALLQESAKDNGGALSQDVHILLPAVKIWCDWMLCHSSVWNPPPSTQDFRVGTAGDAWTRLATLTNLLKKCEQNSASLLVSTPQEGYEQVKLPEDSVLSGFRPLMVNEPDIRYASKDLDPDTAQFALRTDRLLFFGMVFLCGLEPPVLKLEIEDDFREYVSVVCTSNSRDSPVASPDLGAHDDVLMESFSEDEESPLNLAAAGEGPPEEVRDLLNRKVELERAHRRQELHKQRVKKILSQTAVSVHLEVRPKYLIPDTNCFIDHLDRITQLTTSHVYTLMVPIVVLSELEGLSRGGKSPMPSTRSFLDPEHVLKVAQAAQQSLLFLKSRPQAVKCVTTKGAVLSSTTFTNEDDSALDATFKNDDKILATCLVLSKGHNKEQTAENEPRKVVSEVVLLTDDRNLRVKALARDVPVRELVDFMQWAGLG